MDIWHHYITSGKGGLGVIPSSVIVRSCATLTALVALRQPEGDYVAILEPDFVIIDTMYQAGALAAPRVVTPALLAMGIPDLMLSTIDNTRHH